MKYVYVVTGCVLCTGAFKSLGHAEDYFDDQVDACALPEGGVTMLEVEYMADQDMIFEVGLV